MKTIDPPITLTLSFRASKDLLWSALTELNKMTKWFFENIPAFQAEVGFETSFLVSVEDRHFTHIWKILEVVPAKKLCYNWKYEEYPGNAKVCFLLDEGQDQKILRFTMEILEDFPDDIPEFTLESCMAGWQYFLDNRLREYLKNTVD